MLCSSNPVAASDSYAAENCISHFTVRTQYHEISLGASFQLAPAGQARYSRWVQRRQTHSLLHFPSSELHHVTNGAVHGQNAPRQFSASETLAVFQFHVKRPEAITPIGHTGSGSSVGNQHRGIRSFRLQEQPYHRWVQMDSIRNDVGGDPGISQHLTENSWIAVIERAHRIEGVSGVPGARSLRRAG